MTTADLLTSYTTETSPRQKQIAECQREQRAARKKLGADLCKMLQERTGVRFRVRNHGQLYNSLGLQLDTVEPTPFAGFWLTDRGVGLLGCGYPCPYFATFEEAADALMVQLRGRA